MVEPTMAGAARPSTEMMAAAAELGCSLRPGFRFHPTEQELVGWFLRSKVLGHAGLHIHFIPEVNAYGSEPQELPAKSFSPTTCDPGAKVECYFFAPRCRKYPTGFRMDLATENGFWKSTGKDRPIVHNGTIISMKKTLVLHVGHAPRGTLTDWVMHEYRLHGHDIQDTYALCRVFNKNMVTPSTDASGGADADEHPMQFMPSGVDTNNGLMEHMPGGANSEKDPMQSISGGVGTNKDPKDVESESYGAADNVDKDLMQSVLGGGGTDKDPIQIDSDSDGVDADKDLMQSVLGGGGTDKDPIQIDSDSDGADTNKDLMKFLLDDIGTDKDPVLVESEFDGVYTNKGKKQIFVPIGANANKDGTQFVNVSAEANKEGMLPVTSGADVDEDNSDNTWHTDALMEEGNSWMQSHSDDVWYTRVDVDKDDSLMQFIFSDVWLLSAD